MIGERIKQLREDLNLDRSELAKKLNLTYHALSKYETNERQPDYNTLKIIADFFNVSVDYLLGRVDEKNLHVVEGEAIPKELREVGVEYLELAKQMQDDELSPEEVKKILDAVRNLKKDNSR